MCFLFNDVQNNKVYSIRQKARRKQVGLILTSDIKQISLNSISSGKPKDICCWLEGK